MGVAGSLIGCNAGTFVIGVFTASPRLSRFNSRASAFHNSAASLVSSTLVFSFDTYSHVSLPLKDYHNEFRVIRLLLSTGLVDCLSAGRRYRTEMLFT